MKYDFEKQAALATLEDLPSSVRQATQRERLLGQRNQLKMVLLATEEALNLLDENPKYEQVIAALQKAGVR